MPDQIPPPMQVPYATPAPRYYQPNPRPTSVSVIAIVAIVFGGLGLLGTIIGLVTGVALRHTMPIYQAYLQDSLMAGWFILSNIWGLAMVLVLLIGGIKSLSLKPIGRKLLVFYGWCGVVLVIPTSLINTLYINPRIQQWQVAHRVLVASNPLVTHLIQFISMVVGLAISVYLIYAMTRPHVKAAFARGAEAT